MCVAASRLRRNQRSARVFRPHGHSYVPRVRAEYGRPPRKARDWASAPLQVRSDFVNVAATRFASEPLGLNGVDLGECASRKCCLVGPRPLFGEDVIRAFEQLYCFVDSPLTQVAQRKVTCGLWDSPLTSLVECLSRPDTVRCAVEFVAVADRDRPPDRIGLRSFARARSAYRVRSGRVDLSVAPRVAD